MKYRTNRATFWTLFLGLITVYAIMLSFMERPPGAEVPLALVAIPRLHDIGMSGKWVLLGLILEIVIVGIGFANSTGTDGIYLAGGIAMFAILFLMSALGIAEGEPAPNKWGNPPQPGVSLRRPDRPKA